MGGGFLQLDAGSQTRRKSNGLQKSHFSTTQYALAYRASSHHRRQGTEGSVFQSEVLVNQKSFDLPEVFRPPCMVLPQR